MISVEQYLNRWRAGHGSQQHSRSPFFRSSAAESAAGPKSLPWRVLWVFAACNRPCLSFPYPAKQPATLRPTIRPRRTSRWCNPVPLLVTSRWCLILTWPEAIFISFGFFLLMLYSFINEFSRINCLFSSPSPRILIDFSRI